MAKVTTVVIPAAGVGTRLFPASKAIPKELFPIGDRPAIQYNVEEAYQAGIRRVIFVINPYKEHILYHFLPNERVYRQLKHKRQLEALEQLKELETKMEFETVIQYNPHGLGHAIHVCKNRIPKDEWFAIMLGDEIVFPETTPPLKRLVDNAVEHDGCSISLLPVPDEHVNRYGIIGGEELNHDDGLWRVDTLVEKPALEDAPSRMAITGRYVVPATIFDAFDDIGPDARNEIQLTPALQALTKDYPFHGLVLKGERLDIGNPEGLAQANMAWLRRYGQTNG